MAYLQTCRLAACAGFLAGGLTLSAQQAPTLAEGKALFDAGSYPAAAAEFDQATTLQQYNAIISQYSSNVFAASGALHQRGMLELAGQDPAAAKALFEQVATYYPTSPFADDALVGKARTAVGLQDETILDEAEAGLTAMNAAPAQRQKVQLERGEWHAKVKGPGARRESWWETDNKVLVPMLPPP